MTWPYVIGLGSLHGDDQAGWLILKRLNERGFPSKRLFQACHPADILHAVDSETTLIICDACCSAPPTENVTCDDVVSDTNQNTAVKTHQRATERSSKGCLESPKTILQGTIHHLRWPSNAVLYQRATGSHDLSVNDALTLGSRLTLHPVTAEIWAIEGQQWMPGTEPSNCVRLAADQVAQAIWEMCRDA